MLVQPGGDDAVKNAPIEVPTAAHRDPALTKQAHATSNTLSDGNVQRSSAQVVNQKDAVASELSHDAHHGGHWFLHKCHLAQPGGLRSLQGCVFLHLIE